MTLTRGFRAQLASVLAMSWVGIFMLISACDTTENPDAEPLIVFAASSLEGALRDLAPRFSQTMGQEVQFVFAGSQLLRTQLEHGARADVFLSATPAHVATFENADLLTMPCTTFGQSPLVIAATSPHQFFELDRTDRIVIADDSVPLGHYTTEVLQRARHAQNESFVTRLQDRVVARPISARQVRALMEMNQADAAILYQADVLASKHLVATPLPDAVHVDATYAAGALSLRGQEFVELLMSSDAQVVLEAAGINPVRGECKTDQI